MEEENNKKGKCIKVRGKALTIYIIIIVVIASAISFGSGFILGKKMYEEKKKEPPKEIQDKPAEEKPQNATNVNEKSEVTEELLDELKNIGQLDNEDGKISKFTPLLFYEGILNELSDDDKTRIIYAYALKNKMTISERKGENPDCNPGGGSGICICIKVEDFNAIAKKYGFLGFKPDADIINNKYYFGDGGEATPYEKTLHNVTYVINGEDIILTDNLTYKYYSNIDHADDTETREFTFKKGADGSYYLYSVYKK